MESEQAIAMRARNAERGFASFISLTELEKIKITIWHTPHNFSYFFILSRGTPLPVGHIIDHVLDVMPRFASEYKKLSDADKIKALKIYLQGENIPHGGVVSSGSRVTVDLLSEFTYDRENRTYYDRLRTEDLLLVPEVLPSTSDNICSICLAAVAGSVTRTLACNHEFHVQCIKEWAEVKNSCPLCRKDFARITG